MTDKDQARIIAEIMCGMHRDLCCLVGEQGDFSVLKKVHHWLNQYGYSQTKQFIELQCACKGGDVPPPGGGGGGPPPPPPPKETPPPPPPPPPAACPPGYQMPPKGQTK